MQTNRLKINIEDLYISKPLEKETYLKVIGEHPNTIHSLYLITNDLVSLHHFLSLDDHPQYTINAYVSVYHGYCGKAKQQIGIINSMSEKHKQRPFFSITYKIINKSNMKESFSFKHMSTSKKEIYKLIDIFHKKTEELCRANTF
jgi:hypothetical protein